jgi:predicted membrane protein
MTGETDPDRAAARKVAAALYLSAVVTLVVAVLLGLLFGAVYFLIALFAVVDFVIARLFETGKIGPLAGRRQAEDSGDAATIAESDPGNNPYARED